MSRNLYFAFLFIACTALPIQCEESFEKQIYALLDNGKSQEALDTLEKWKTINGENDPQYWVAAANTWFQIAAKPTLEISPLSNGKYRAQVGSDSEIILTDPKSGKEVGKITEGAPQVDETKARKAISFLDEGIRRNPQRLDIFTGRAHLYRAIADLKGELAALERLVKDPKPKDGKFEIGPKKIFDGSVEEYKLEMLMAYAREHLEKQNKNDDNAAKAIAELTMRMFPKRPHGYNLMGVMASYENNWPEFKKWLLLALEQDAKDSLVIMNLGNCYEHLGDTKSAIEQYKKVILLNSDAELVSDAKIKLEKLESK
jgi:tetratricopeptide (TPR) repeat protein